MFKLVLLNDYKMLGYDLYFELTKSVNWASQNRHGFEGILIIFIRALFGL